MANQTPLKRLMAGKKGLTDLHIPTITEDAEDVVGMQGRIRLQKDDRIATSQWMDKQRSSLQAYEYLCHIGEAKEWIEDCLQIEIDPITQLEESMRNGIILARLAGWFAPGVVRKIFTGSRLQFRHIDNINSFFEALNVVHLPKIFWFETTDLYDKKNIPKAIYCIHALSHLLARRNMAPTIKNLVGTLHFADEVLRATQRTLDSSGVKMPPFSALQMDLGQQLGVDVGTIPYESPTTPDLIKEGEESDPEEDLFANVDREQAYWQDACNLEKLIRCQAIARSWLSRRENDEKRAMQQSTFFLTRLSGVQAHARGVLMRKNLEEKQFLYDQSSEWISKLQALVRGYLCRNRYHNTLAHYHANMDKVICVQSFMKNKLAGNAYRKLTTDNNPSLGTVKNFVHLLNDNDLDFDCDIALHEMRQQVVELIRENAHMDSLVSSLDSQIGLLLRNAITIDEVVKTSSAFKKKQQHRRMSELAASSSRTNPFSLTGIDKESAKRLKLYQQMLYVLQTEPHYLARLLSMTGRHHIGEYASIKVIEQTVMTLFGYGSNKREEYLLINLCKSCIDEEMKHVKSTREFMCSNYTFMKLVVQTNRGAKERRFFRKLLRPLIQNIVDDEYLDLENDPVAIYHKKINDEESATGRSTLRNRAATCQDALKDKSVCDTFISHLRQLREMAGHFLDAILATVDDVPYGMRILARKLRLTLEEAFPNEPRKSILGVIGNFIYYRYLNPAIIAPEQYDIVDAIVLPVQRKNLAEIAKVLHKIASGEPFKEDGIFLAPLNDFVLQSTELFTEWLLELTNVEEPASYFDINELDDHTTTQKPSVIISPRELFHLHYVLDQNLADIDPEGSVLTQLIKNLGPSPYDPTLELPEALFSVNLSAPSDPLSEDSSSRQRQVLTDAKRLVIYIIRIQSGANLKDILAAPVGENEEQLWLDLKKTEFSTQGRTSETVTAKRRYVKLGQNDPALDLESVNFYALKVITERLLHYLIRLELLADDGVYQSIINLIAQDITGKNARRQQRDHELSQLRQTLAHLKQKQGYLLEKKDQYEGYLSSSMEVMATKRGKRPRYMMPFTRQYFHVRGLKKQGLEPKFGSFKYTAKQLFDRGILVELDGIQPKHYDKISIILSMDHVNIITIEGSYSGWSITSVQVDLRYEELLQIQFEGQQTMKVLDGMVKVNVNLLIYLINKKFYA